MSETRCAGCGKIVEDGVKVKRVSTGKLQEGAFAEAREWGVLHEECFNSSIDSPDLALAEIKKLARKASITHLPQRRARNA